MQHGAHTAPFTSAVGKFLLDPIKERQTWCDQPDLQELHAAYIHPLSFSYTDQVFPVFGNSKTAGYDDILVPSWWHWFEWSPYIEQDDWQWQTKRDNVRPAVT